LNKIILHPLKGIEFKNKDIIEFGTLKTELFKKLGQPTSEFEKQLFYDNLELRIDIDDSEKIEFIEFIYGPFPEKTEIELYGVNPFDTVSDRLIEILTEHNNGQLDDSEAPYSYAFHESSIGIFRDSCESDVKEMIKEMTANGENPENEDWVAEDKQKAKYFWTVGIGRLDYYK